MASALTEPDPGLGATSLSLLGSSSSHVEPQSSCAANSSACWPHMFLVGAQKSATTSLFDLFHRNGAACGASYLPDQGMFKPRHQFFSPKEVHLFDAPPDEFAEVVREPARYTRLYRRSACNALHQMDATPYLHAWSAPLRMVQLIPPHWLPETRFLAILREPLSRDLSWYNHRLTEPNWEFCAPSPHGTGVGHGPTYAAEAKCGIARFETCLDAGRGNAAGRAAAAKAPSEGRANATSSSAGKRNARLRNLYLKCMESGLKPGAIASGIYGMHYHRWTHFIPRSQMMFLEFDSMMADVETHISAAVSFFGLPSAAARNVTKAKKLRMTNDHRTSYKLNKVECSTASELTRTFRPWNEMLYALLADRSQAPPMEPPFPRFTVRVPCTNVKQKLPSPLAESTNATGSSDTARPWRVELLA